MSNRHANNQARVFVNLLKAIRKHEKIFGALSRRCDRVPSSMKKIVMRRDLRDETHGTSLALLLSRGGNPGDQLNIAMGFGPRC